MENYPRLMRTPASLFLQRLTKIAGTALPESEALSRAITSRTFAAGDPLFHEGDCDSTVRLVTRGLGKLAYEDAKGRAFTKAVLEPGDIFASMTGLAGGPASFSAVSLTTMEVQQAPWEALRRLASRHHAWAVVSSRLFMDLARRKEIREFELLTLGAAERWRRLTEQRPHLVRTLPQAELAALIGITPVALSRLKARTARSRPGGSGP